MTDPTTDAIVIFDDLCRIAFVSDAAATLWGIRRQEMIGRDFRSLVALSSDEAGLLGVRNGDLGTAAAATSERRIDIDRAQGDVCVRHECRMSITTARGRDAPLHVARFRAARADGGHPPLSPESPGLDWLGTPIVVTDADGEIVYVNASANQVFGDPDPRLRQALAGVAAAARHEEAAAWTTNSGSTVRDECLIPVLDGQPHWFSAIAHPIFGTSGALTHTVSVLIDITDIKMRETIQQAVLEAMAHDAPLPDVMKILCVEIERMVPGVAVSVLSVDDKGQLHTLAAPSLPDAYTGLIEGLKIGPKVGSCGTAAFLGEPVAVTDILTDPLWADYREAAKRCGMAACWSTPFRAADGTVIGTFGFYYRTRRGPDALHEKLTRVCTHLCVLALERDAARERIHRQAFEDALTGLPNRLSLRMHIEPAIASAHRFGVPLALMIVNLDGFKAINDSLGQAQADLLLQHSARRIDELVPAGAIVGRHAGDEFAVAVLGFDARRALGLAEAIRVGLAEVSEAIPGRQVYVSASIGVCVLPEHGDDRETLLRRADLAVRAAKRAGRDCVRLFDAQQEACEAERMQLEHALKEALVHDELSLHYQPKIRLRDGRLTGVEALARWRHPELGDIAPARFIPLAEASGLIVELGCWALRESCRQIARWRDEGVPVPSVAVNLSPLHFRQAELAPMIASILDEHGLSGSALTVEITESVFMENRPEILSTIAAVRAHGVRLSLDDFGTGYASLAQLLDLPVDELKLDQQFVSRLNSHEAAKTLIAAAIRIGHGLGLTVVAEGIEDDAQRACLFELGCEVGQGYLFAKPMPASALGGWLAERGIECKPS